MRPLTLCAYEVDAEPVFDALDEAEREALSVSDSELACPAWEAEMLAGKISESQALADRLIATGYTGMRVGSFAAGAGADDVNLVLWKRVPDRPFRVVLIGDEGRCEFHGRLRRNRPGIPHASRYTCTPRNTLAYASPLLTTARNPRPIPETGHVRFRI